MLDAGLARQAQLLRRDHDLDVDRIPGAGGRRRGRRRCTGLPRGQPDPPASTCCSTSSASTPHWPAPTWWSTGEGSFDRQSLAGKAPVGVARRAWAAGVPVVVLAGRVDLDATDRARLADLGIVGTHALLDLEPDLGRAMARAGPLLRKLAEQAFATFPTLTRSPA